MAAATTYRLDQRREEATHLVRMKIENAILIAEPEIKSLVGTQQHTELVIASALFTAALEVLVHASPDEDRYVRAARNLQMADDEKLRQFYRGVRKTTNVRAPTKEHP